MGEPQATASSQPAHDFRPYSHLRSMNSYFVKALVTSMEGSRFLHNDILRNDILSHYGIKH